MQVCIVGSWVHFIMLMAQKAKVASKSSTGGEFLKCLPPPGGGVYDIRTCRKVRQSRGVWGHAPLKFVEICVSEMTFPAFWQHFWALLIACESTLGIKISIRIIHEVFELKPKVPPQPKVPPSKTSAAWGNRPLSPLPPPLATSWWWCRFLVRYLASDVHTIVSAILIGVSIICTYGSLFNVFGTYSRCVYKYFSLCVRYFRPFSRLFSIITIGL